MKKIVMSLAVITATVALQAGDTALLSGGKVSGQIKAMHILGDKTNGFAPENGSAYLGTLKYVTPDLWTDGLKAGAAFYINGDTGLTKWDDANGKNAQGMFTGSDTVVAQGDGNGGDTATLLGEAYLEYKSKMIDVKIGRQILNTPLTKIKWSLMPNFYQGAVATVKPLKGLSLTAFHTNAMAYGSRSAADYMLIGEGTGTAGVFSRAVQQNTGTREQAKFINFGKGTSIKAAGADDTSGMTAFNVTYKAGKNLKISLWDYIVHDYANNLYADAMYKLPVMSKGTNLTLNAQYLKQSDDGNKYAGELDFAMYGAKAKLGNKKWSVYAAYNSSNNKSVTTPVTIGESATRYSGGFFNAWGADPAYTSSLFSRNAYRQDVSAYKIGGHYAIMKGLKLVVSHADYGKSKTGAAGGNGIAPGTLATNDATETDIVLVYKPTKAWMLKIFNAMRTSEYSDASTQGRKMNHVRAVASYTF